MPLINWQICMRAGRPGPRSRAPTLPLNHKCARALSSGAGGLPAPLGGCGPACARSGAPGPRIGAIFLRALAPTSGQVGAPPGPGPSRRAHDPARPSGGDGHKSGKLLARGAGQRATTASQQPAGPARRQVPAVNHRQARRKWRAGPPNGRFYGRPMCRPASLALSLSLSARLEDTHLSAAPTTGAARNWRPRARARTRTASPGWR